MATYSMTSALGATGTLVTSLNSGTVLAPGESVTISGTLQNKSVAAIRTARIMYTAEYLTTGGVVRTYDQTYNHPPNDTRIAELAAACSIAKNARGSFSVTIRPTDTWRTRFRNYAKYPDWYDETYYHNVGSIDLTDETDTPLRIHIQGVFVEDADGYGYNVDTFLLSNADTVLFPLQVCNSGAPTLSAALEDRAASDALEAFGALAMNHSLPWMASEFALDSWYPALTASHSLTLSGAMSATLTASTAAGVTEQAFQLPALTVAGTVAWSYTVTDSYGGTATVTGSFEVLAYSPPAFISMTPERYAVVLDQGSSSHVPADYGTWLWLTYSAVTAAVTGTGGEHNPWTLTAVWSPDIGSGGGSQLIESDTDGRVLGATRNEGVTYELSASSGWVVRLELADALNSVSIEGLLVPGHALFDIEPNGVAVGMHSGGTAQDKRFEVAQDYTARFYGPVRMAAEDISGLYSFARTAGACSVTAISAVRVGNMVNVAMAVVYTGTTSSGGNVLTGVLSGGPLPAVDTITMGSYWQASGAALYLKPNGELIVRAIGGTFGQKNITGTFTISFITNG